MIGEAFVGLPGVKLALSLYSGPLRHALVGRLLFGQDPIFYLSIALVFGVSWFLFRTRRPDAAFVGDSHASAHALGIPVIRYPLSGRDVRRRLRGPRRRRTCRSSTRRNGSRT
jgi:ABC-type uncharacterized transport system permease subunit